MIRPFAILSVLAISACGTTPGGVYPGYQPLPGQGQYQRPAYQNPQPTLRLPPVDACRSQLYQGLVGQHEGAIHIPGLPGRKRILKPAFQEDFDRELVAGIDPDPPLVRVREYLADQVLYAPSIDTVTDAIRLGPVIDTRLTIELDREGYVQEVRCQ